MFCCILLWLYKYGFTHICQGYFNGPGVIIWLFFSSGTTLIDICKNKPVNPWGTVTITTEYHWKLWVVIMWLWLSLYPPQRSWGGVYWIHPVRPSVCPSVCLSVRPSVRPWVGVRMITLILISGFKNFFLHISLGSRSCMGLNISVLPH